MAIVQYLSCPRIPARPSAQLHFPSRSPSFSTLILSKPKIQNELLCVQSVNSSILVAGAISTLENVIPHRKLEPESQNHVQLYIYRTVGYPPTQSS